MALPPLLNSRRLKLFGCLVGNGLAQTVATLATAWLVKLLFDRLLTPAHPIDTTVLIGLGAGLLATAALAAWLRLAERTNAERLGQDYVSELRTALFKHLSRLSPRLLQSRSRGGVLLRFVGDLSALRQWLSQGLARLTVAGITLVSTVAALAWLNAILAGVVGTLLLAGALLSLALGKPLRNAATQARRRRSQLAGNITEKLTAMSAVQACGQVRREQRRVQRQSQRLAEAMIARARWLGGLRALADLTAALASAAALLLGAGQVASGQATVGTVVATLSVIGLLTPALRDLGRVHEYWHGAMVARTKVLDFLALPTLPRDLPEATALPEGPGRLELRDVHTANTLAGVSVTAPAGSRVALVGPNGAGKSTLLAVTMRLLEPSQGQVLLDGQDLAAVKRASLHRAIGMVSTELPLLRGTLEKNLRYRWPAAPAEEIARVIALCGLDELFADWPQGLQTRLNEGGGNLSQGQWQRIALARALVGQPRLLLLDETDANLDPTVRATLQRALAEFQGTVLQITHRWETVRRADCIWHLAAGRLVEAGAPATLLQNDGPTARLFGRSLALVS